MGILDSISALSGGSGKRTIPVQLQPGEHEVGRCSGMIRPNSLTSVGGELILTNLRLVFTPWSLKDIAAVLGWAIGKAGGPATLAGLPARVAQFASQQAAGMLSSVRAGSDGSTLKWPTILLSGADGASHEFGVGSSFGSPVWSSKNRVARDDFLRLVQQTLASA